jgi:hypothetical protein
VKKLLELAAWFALGYVITNKGIPYMQAKIEAMDLDSVWELWDEEEWM